MDSQAIQEFRENLRTLERKLTARLDGDAICCGVTVTQCHTLLAIEEQGNTTVTELAAKLGLDKSTLSRTIDSLVAAGLVNRDTNTENRRSLHISLTPEGDRVTAGIHNQWNNYFRSLFAEIPESKHAIVLEAISILSEVIPSSTCCNEANDWGTDVKESPKVFINGKSEAP